MDWMTYFQTQSHQASRQTLKQYYRSGCTFANAPLSAVEMVALDIETTGLNSQEHGITSIGLVPFSLQRIQLNEAKHWLVKPRKPLAEDSITIHQITHSDLADAPDFSEVFDELLQALQGKLVVAHFHKIERQFLRHTVRNRFDEDWLFPMLDTMQIEANLHRQPRWKPSQWFRRQASIRLADARQRYQLPAYRNHNAMLDALATAELLQAQVAYHLDSNDSVGQHWC
ncbi:3'-5' exonuclease [Salinibius halmophilus]|uniref:3'-5' exonuclease n=1 Tax=Salinibius halmophilus TaxID=1853216 RepID=UPI000E66FE14|nr:3'-5' exonuclease [Salinibius halmophilus]